MRRRFALPLLVLVTLAGCDSGGGDSELCASYGATASGSLSATAAGESFSAACVSGQFTDGVLAISGIENIDGSAGATQRQINLTIASAEARTYSLPSFAGIVATYADVDLQNPTLGTYAGTSGSITVDEVSSSGASGSFSFTGTDNGGATVQVSGGRFDVTF